MSCLLVWIPSRRGVPKVPTSAASRTLEIDNRRHLRVRVRDDPNSNPTIGRPWKRSGFRRERMFPEVGIDSRAEGSAEALELLVAPGVWEMNAMRKEGGSVVIDVDHPAVNVLGIAGSELAGRWVIGVVSGYLDGNPVVIFGMNFQGGLADQREGLVVLVCFEVADPEILVGMCLVDGQAPSDLGVRGIGVRLEVETNDDENLD